MVGVVGDEEIARCKGPPVLTMEERLAMVESVKWVDEILEDVPYEITPEFLATLFTEHRIDYVLHGDDPCLLPDGTDAYASAKAAGKFITVKRTEGVSTTDIVGRMLLSAAGGRAAEGGVDLGKLRNFLPTSRRITQFSSGRRPAAGQRVVYVDGDWDVFHSGHIALLKAARKLGDFLIAGIFDDGAVQERSGPHHPILNLQERALGVLSSRYVDEIIMGAPPTVTRDLISNFRVDIVVPGLHATEAVPKIVRRYSAVSCSKAVVQTMEDRGAGGLDGYAVPKALGILEPLDVSPTMTKANTIKRILQSKAVFEAKYAKKAKKEAEYVETKEDREHVEEL